tara:strand:- start:562 stop:1086 length:525 start_codon:yes stop_codon:yes gene_type:complete
VADTTNSFNSKSKNVAVFFGDETFPTTSKGRSVKKFKRALGTLAQVLKELDVKYVYIPSYKGTNLIAAEVLSRLKIPYTLVIPHPSFGGVSSKRQKVRLAGASSKAHKTVMLGEDTGAELMFDVEAATTDLREYISRHCNSIIIAHGERPTKKFTKLLKGFPDDAFEKQFHFVY